jgi:hypothetical protein
LAKITNRLGGYCILPTATANRLGRGRLLFLEPPVSGIVFIIGCFKIAFQFGFWASFGPDFNFSKKTLIIFGPFAFWYKALIIFEWEMKLKYETLEASDVY